MKIFTKLAIAAACVASAANVSAQGRTDMLWVLGDATPYGWSTDDATAILATANDPKVYSGTMYLEADKNFKFLTTYDFGNMEYRAATADATPDADGKVSLVLSDSGDDFQIHVAESANYLITVDTEALEATIVKSAYQDTQVRWASIFMVGSALESGWSVDQGMALAQNPAMPCEFSITNAPMLEGTFKIATALKGSGTWNNAFWYFCDPADPSKMVLNADGDHQWSIPAAGKYDVKANLATNAISITASSQSGVAGVEADLNADGPVAYYTIDGRKVATPAAGSLVIKVSADGTATKVRF